MHFRGVNLHKAVASFDFLVKMAVRAIHNRGVCGSNSTANDGAVLVVEMDSNHKTSWMSSDGVSVIERTSASTAAGRRGTFVSTTSGTAPLCSCLIFGW